MIFDCKVVFKVLITLGRLIFATGRESVDVKIEQMKFWLYDKKINFNVCQFTNNQKTCS